MASRIIEAEARIKGADLTGPAFASVTRRMADLKRQAQAASSINFAGQVEGLRRLDGALGNALATANRIDGFRRLHGEMIASRTAFRAAEVNVRSAAAAMAESGSKTGIAAAQYRAAQRAVADTAAAYRDKAEAVKAAKKELEGYAITTKNMATLETAAKNILNQRRAELVPASPGSAPAPLATAGQKMPHPHAPEGMTSAGLIYGLPLVGGAIKAAVDAVTAGARVDSERARMRSAGWDEKEIGTAEHRANRFAVDYGVSPASSMGIIREARTVFGGDLQQTLKSVPDFFSVRTAMKQASPKASDEELDRAMGQVIKAAEIGGYSKDPARLSQFADFMTKMSQVHGSTLRGEEIVNFFKSAKTAGSSADFEFLKNVLPTLLPEQGGDRIGTAAMTFRQAMIGGKMKHIAAKNLAEMGLIDEKFVERTDDGAIKGVKRGGLKGQQLAETNPLEWVKQFLIPAMDAKGIKPEDRSATVSSLFTDRNAEYFVSTLVNNMDRLLKDRDAVERAKGLKGAEETLKDDPRVAAGRLKAGLENVGAAVTDPLMSVGKAAMDASSAILALTASFMRGETISTPLAAGPQPEMDAAKDRDRWRFNQDAILEQARRQQRFYEQYPEARRGEGFKNIGQSDDKRVEVTLKPDQVVSDVKQPVPVDVTGKVAIDPASKVTVNVTVRALNAQVTGMSATSSGNAQGNVNTYLGPSSAE